ncbi:glycosyltransferase family 4 protein [uncultured Christiangramia sp.]|uniref:glycosyltransferase family 4 protein n=1 Tax=Christiangramia sp. 3-2217-3z TaxID=3417564 RepID=UPI002639D9BA|nr:glycosyltransferase family 4 protein [uncultured Christiangramia sp.]
MKILHLALTKKWGGGANQIQNLCKELINIDDFELHLLTIADGELHKRISDKNIHLHVTPMAFKADLRAAIKLIRVCLKYKIDLIHIHGPTALTIAVLAYHLKKLPPFIFSKKTSFTIRQNRGTLIKYNHPNLKRILCVSEKTKDISKPSIQDHSKLITVYHGTDIHSKSGQPPFKLREKFNIEPETVIVGMIANHVKPKDLHTWVAVINEIVNIKNNTIFRFVQFGSYSEITKTLKNNIRELKLEKYINFLGFVPEASKFIPQFDISLMTSQSEGIPQFIYESFYYKVPVVATEVGGIPEIITNGENGFLSRPHDGVSLANKLVLLSQDRSLQQKFTKISYQRLLENYTTERMAANTLAQYKEVLYGKNGTGS